MTNKIHNRHADVLIRAVTGLATMLIGSPTWAQEPETNVLEEVVVTAQKREERAQDVPISITAVGKDALERRGLTNVAQLGSYLPNVEIKNTVSFAGSSQILVASIRGAGQNDFAFNLEPGVGVYIDGVYFARSLGAVVDLLDLDRIEVLRGPQGTLFGRNTIGGALNIVTREPGDEAGYQLEATTGEFHRADIRGSVDIPLVEDRWLSQFSFSSKQRDGYQKRIPFPGTIGQTDAGSFIAAGSPGGSNTQGGEKVVNFRGKLKGFVTDNLNILLSADYSRADQESRPSTLLATFAGPTDGTALAAYNGCIFGAAPPFICSTRGAIDTSYSGVRQCK